MSGSPPRRASAASARGSNDYTSSLDAGDGTATIHFVSPIVTDGSTDYWVSQTAEGVESGTNDAGVPSFGLAGIHTAAPTVVNTDFDNPNSTDTPPSFFGYSNDPNTQPGAAAGQADARSRSRTAWTRSRGKKATTAAILKNDGFRFSFKAPERRHGHDQAPASRRRAGSRSRPRDGHAEALATHAHSHERRGGPVARPVVVYARPAERISRSSNSGSRRMSSNTTVALPSS